MQTVVSRKNNANSSNSSDKIDNIKLVNCSIKEILISEKINIGRAKSLLDKIKSEGVWTKPILVGKKHRVVMDGHHRLWVAQNLGLRHVPCLLLSYDHKNLTLSRWDGGSEIHPEVVIAAALSGELLEYKTTKHVLSGDFSCPPVSLDALA